MPVRIYFRYLLLNSDFSSSTFSGSSTPFSQRPSDTLAATFRPRSTALASCMVRSSRTLGREWIGKMMGKWVEKWWENCGKMVEHLENGGKMVEKWIDHVGKWWIFCWKRHEPNELNLSLNPTFGSFRWNRLCHLALSRERSQALCLLFVLPGYLVWLATMETSPCLCSICAVVDGIWFILIPPSWMGFLMMNNNEYTYIPNHGPLTMAHVLKYMYLPGGFHPVIATPVSQSSQAPTVGLSESTEGHSRPRPLPTVQNRVGTPRECENENCLNDDQVYI